MKRKRLFLLLASICLVLVLAVSPFMAACAPAEEAPTGPIQLSLQSAYGGHHFSTKLSVQFMALVTERSEQRITFTYYPQSSLMGRKAAWDAVRERVLDIAITAPAYSVDTMGIVGTTEWMAMGWTSGGFHEHARDKGSYYDWAQPYYENVGLRLLAMPMEFAGLMLSRKPLAKLEDMEGHLMRDSGGMALWQEALGFHPMPIAGEDFYEAVMRGVIDGGVQSISGYVDQKWYEVAPYVMQSIIRNPSNMALVINLDAYNLLPDDLKAIVDQAAIDSEDWLWEENQDIFKEMKAEIMRYPGATWWETSPEEEAKLREMVKPYMQELAEKYGEEWESFAKVLEQIR